MVKYCLPIIPSVYWIDQVNFKCQECGLEFVSLESNGDSVVKFIEEDGYEIRWLPIYGKGGYLDLLPKLIPEFNVSDTITMKVAREFEERFKLVSEPSLKGNLFNFNGIKHCKNCGSIDINRISEIVLTSPPIEWMKIECDLVKAD